MKRKILWAALILGILTVSALAFYPEWRVRWQSWILPDKKDLLATVTGDLLNTGTDLKILKFATARGLIVEVHEPSANPDMPYKLVDRIFIPDRHDGFFTINNQPTRLAIVDVDGDGTLEILAPSFDEKLIPHLNTLKLIPESRKLQLVRPQ